jgi:ParB-like chromosome segregation protein Spo0J
VAARQIVKNAGLRSVPVVIATHEDLDAAAILELGARQDEYVTRLSDYRELEPLFEYLLQEKSASTSSSS